jgi:tight adherence protein B
MILIVTVLVFLASTALVLGAEALRERMASHAISARLARPTLHTRVLTVTPKDRRRSVLPWLDRALHGFALGDRIDTVILQSGVNMRAGVLVLVSACAAAAGLLSGVLVLHSLGLATLLAPIGATLPWLWVLERRHSRSMAFSREFPDALGLLVSGLRAGLSFSAAMQIVAQESPEPVATEFSITVEEQSLGLDLRETLERLCHRVDSLDLRFFTTAVLLQRETGGNLAEVLANTASLIRERFRVIGDIRTMTAQGKMTGAILIALPVVMALGTYAFAGEYFRPMLESPDGRAALWTAAVMQVVGVWWCWRIVSIKV